MRNTEPHFDEDQYLQEQYGDDEFELLMHLEDVEHEERCKEQWEKENRQN